MNQNENIQGAVGTHSFKAYAVSQHGDQNGIVRGANLYRVGVRLPDGIQYFLDEVKHTSQKIAEDFANTFAKTSASVLMAGAIVFVATVPGEILNDVVYEQAPIHNLIVTSGKDLVLDRLFGLSGPPAAISSVGVGTDNTAAALGQTKLNPTVTGSVLIQTADAGTSRTAETVTITSTFGTGVANFTWAEAGLFNGNVNGTSLMFNRVVIGPFTKTSAVTIVYTTTILQS